jgi:uncharacterized damage-inducible protein DinB
VNVEQVRELFDYNRWPNRRIFEALAALPAEEYMRDLKSSVGSIHGTLSHLVGAERVWRARWRGEAGSLLKGSEVASLAEVRKLWDSLETERTQYLSRLTAPMLDSEIVIKPTGGGQFVHTLRQTMQHTVDHSSYHRGQIVTLMRQLGVKPPSTGLIGFYRGRSKPA